TTPNLYRLGNLVSFAFGRGLAFDPIFEYGKLRTVGHMGHVRELHLIGDTPILGGSRIRRSRSKDAGDTKSTWQACGRSASTPAGDKRRARRNRPARSGGVSSKG